MNVTARRLLFALPLWFAVPMLSGCTESISGQPEAVPDPAPSTSPSDSNRKRASGVVGEPRIPAPRSIEGIDPCSLLTPQELAGVGGAIGPPHPDNPLPGACSHLVGGGPEDSAGAGFHLPYSQAAAKQPRGVQVSVDGHSTWLYCEVIEDYQTCTATTAVRQDRSLLTLLSKRSTSAADTADMLFALTRGALSKLPSI